MFVLVFDYNKLFMDGIMINFNNSVKGYNELFFVVEENNEFDCYVIDDLFR